MAEALAEREEVEEELMGLDPERVEAILHAVVAQDRDRLTDLMAPLHAADIADLLEQIGPTERRNLLHLWSGEIDGEILSEIDDSIREEVIDALPHDVLTEAVRELETDDVVDILEDLEQPQQDVILNALEDADRVAVEAAMAYPEHSAGRLMQREVVLAPEHWTVGEAIDYLRAADHLPDQFYHVILVDPRMKPQGYVTLGRLLSSKRAVALRDITEDSFRTIVATEAESEVAYIFNQYHLISCPVVDENDRLVGVITIDDAMNVLDEEHEEDILRLAGVSEESHMSDGPWETARTRIPWLVINLFTASISAFVISRFESTIAALVTLAALMPIVASTGGIAGTQSLAVSVRALATRDLTSSNARRVVLREIGAGLLNGIALAAILGIGAFAVFGDLRLGIVLGMAMICNQVVAALSGVLIPLGLHRVGMDPALASGTFVTTLTDVLGYLTFLGFATMLLL
ncbi:MAG: magnesium transporter [Cereibacter sphaeroides]|uniref:Magnesium transporter MgtE n=1 Tax=Cereibacter sphaeroides TaxID=1063 RepID=A0A2W5SD43_CERSP|nr:MAG: magnesium transporter [Cereibacter sphaeroides]